MFVRASGLALRAAIENPSDFPRGLDRLWAHAETIPAAQALNFFRDTARRGSVVILCGMDGVEIAALLTYINQVDGDFLVETLDLSGLNRAIRLAERQMVEPSFEERILSQDRTGLITSIRRDTYLGEYVLQYYADSNFYSPDVRWTKTKDQFTFDEISADDAVHSLDLKTGKEKWVHFTGAAVRLPPTIASGNLYFGSDDGYAYCCDKSSGELIWRTRASKGNRHITSNRKLMSLWPVRTGVLVDGKQAVFAGSLVPWEKSYLCSVDALSGGVESEQGFRRELANVTLQGALLASSKKLFVPQGRAAPLAFDRKDGTPRGKIGEAGGVFCILSEDDMLFAGPPHQKERDDQIRVANLDSNASVASFTGTNRILVAADLAWLATDGKLKCLDRSQNVQARDKMRKIQNDLKKKTVTAEQAKPLLQEAQKQLKDAWQWEVESDVPFDMVKAGDAVIVGLNGSVRAYSAVDGKLLWQESLAGTAHGLAIVAGMLIVSTDLGHIHAFATVQ